MKKENNTGATARPIMLFGRDRALSITYTCILGLIPPVGLVFVVIRYQLTNALFLTVLAILFLLPIVGYLINIPRMKKEDKDRLEFCVDPKGLYYLNPINGKHFCLKWSEIKTIRPVLFYNYERRLEIIPLKGEKRSVNLDGYTSRINAYSLKRSIIHYSGRTDIWESKGPLFLW